MNNHKAPLKLYDNIVHLFNEYISSNNFDQFAKLKSRKSFIQSMESSYRVTHLWPKNREVMLHDGSEVTVPVFDAKSIILDLLTNKITMDKANIAEGYNVFTDDVDDGHTANKKCGEIHTSDAWLPAHDRFCTPKDVNNIKMPVGLVIFGDKSHTDLHGALSLTPIIFTLTMFNRTSKNNTNFWRPLGYIPNLGYSKNKADKTETRDKIQDEHTCLSVVFESVREIHRKGGFLATVMGREITIKVWIHYFIGDTEGNKKWLGHYPGNKSQVSQPYRDCQCDFSEMSNPNPTCVLTTIEEMCAVRRLKRENNKEGLTNLKLMS
jgi:hypothetical protein